jgi:hypothetical protein
LAAFLLTEAIEVSVALLLGYRRVREIAAVILVNLVTHPLLNYLLLLNDYFGFGSARFPIVLLLEIGVILAEWALLLFALRQKKLPLLGLSVTMNACSYLIGGLIFGFS